MLYENVSVQKLLNNFNIKSTRFIFLVFSVILLSLLIVFFLVIENGWRNKNSETQELLHTKIQLKVGNDLLSDELENSFNRSLLFHQISKESDRFQTIYSLRNTSKLFDEYFEESLNIDENGALSADFTNLKSAIIDYEILIAESINSDGKVTEMMSQIQNPDDSVDQFLFESESLGMEVEEARNIEASLSGVQTQLFNLDNQITLMVNQKLNQIESKNQAFGYVVLAVIFFIMMVIFSVLILARTKSTVLTLSKILNNIARGELPDIRIKSEKEFTPILDSSNEIVSYLDHASQFARHIGDGDFNYEFAPKSKEDALGNSLIEMRNRLQQVTTEDKIRNWINEGQAKFGEILRQYNDDLQDLGTNLISNLVSYLNANQGGLFVLKEEGERQYLELLSAYAFNRKKFIEKKLEIGEGLAGQAFSEGKTIYLKEIKTDHYNIVTGLGESRPTSLLIVPLKEEDKIEGVIEIASFEEIKPHEIEFIESIGESIASSLNSGKINETTKQLLNETQEKAEEMKAQEEELRQNMEELAATQEQMERRNKELEEIQTKFDKERYLLNALLNSSNDRIYFKDKESKFIRVSQSMIDLFDKKDESEVLGKSDFDFGFEEHAKVAFEDEQRIIQTGRPMEDVVEKEQWDDGRITWVSTTKNPLRDLEGNTVGTFGISRNVTKSKQMELDLHKRKEWLESFFKYHSVGFVVIDQNGKVAFATSEILAQLGKGDISDMMFEDIFAEINFEDFLRKIDFKEVKDEKIQIELNLNDVERSASNYIVISSSRENEDKTQNIFVIQN